MAAQKKQKKSSWDNKYIIGGVVASLSVGALAYYALKSSTNGVRSQNDPQNSATKKQKKEICTSCDVGGKTNNIEFSTPMNAFHHGKREKLLFTTATRTDNVSDSDAGDFVAVVDVDPSSKTYCQIIGQVDLGKGEEVHHSGWNACASCYGMNGVNRKYLVVPAFTSGNVHFIDVSDPKNPTLHKVSSL